MRSFSRTVAASEEDADTTDHRKKDFFIHEATKISDEK